ncbi:MAG: iron ABC transporter permease [Pseudomonadota bacterium]
MILYAKRALSAGVLLPLLATAIIAAPVVSTLWIGLMEGGGATWTHITQTFLFRYVIDTMIVLSTVTVLSLSLAVPAAWLVTQYEFPGRSVFGWCLILPLAAPGYVLAFSYADLLGVSGPIQAFIRDMTGLSARDYWFPNIYSRIGCGFVLAASLYPYVFLTARAAFATQSSGLLNAARCLGASPTGCFWRVALPSARPAILAGLSLALMESAADFGAADFLGVQTLTVGVFRAWSSFADPAAGARLSILLVFVTGWLLWAERHLRRRQGFASRDGGFATSTRTSLPPTQSALASLFCLALFSIGFAIPVVHLVHLAIDARSSAPPILDLVRNTFLLAAVGTVAALAICLPIALAAHRSRPLAQWMRLIASSGYAIPGAVLALGGMYALSNLSISFSGSLALAILVLIYVSRFSAAGISPVEAALGRVPPSVSLAARSLGAGPFRRLYAVELPVITPGLAVAALILFVEILKELPATLMLRPFNWDTLAVKAYAYASDERLEAAALPSLMITLCGLLPVLLLSWRLSHSGNPRTTN